MPLIIITIILTGIATINYGPIGGAIVVFMPSMYILNKMYYKVSKIYDKFYETDDRSKRNINNNEMESYREL